MQQLSVRHRRILQELSDAPARRWLTVSGIAIGILASVSAIFWREAAGAFRVWNDSPTFNHCFLIVPISVFMMWSRRKNLVDVSIVSAPLAAAAVFLLSLIWLATSILGILEAQQFAALTLFQAILFGVLGRAVYGRMLAPLLYLYFLIPSGAIFVPALQQITAYFAVFCLHLIGIPVFSNGAVIEIPAGTFAVAEACAGLRFLVATVAFGVFFACETYRSIPRRLVFVSLCVIVPVVANGLRVFGLIAAAQWIGDVNEALADHLIYGWGFFSVVLIALVFAGRAFSDDGSADDSPPQNIVPFLPKLGRAGLTAILCAAIALTIPVTAGFLDQDAPANLPNSPPALGTPWRQVSDDGNWRPIVSDPARTFQDAYSDGNHTVYRFVALYVLKGRVSNLIRSENRVADEKDWKYNSGSNEQVEVHGQKIPVNVTVVDSGSRRLVIWSFYIVDNQVVADVWRVKWLQFEGFFKMHRCPSAFFALAQDDTSQKNISSAILTNYFSAMGSLPPYVCSR